MHEYSARPETTPCESVSRKIQWRTMKVESTPEHDRWLDGLRDFAGRARIQARIERLAQGNPGQHRNLGGGLSELKIDTGPGYRVYYTQRSAAQC